jgi:DNA ligase-4
VEGSDKFRFNYTLRFPRFKQLRTDKKWDQALSREEFYEVKANAEYKREEKEKEFEIEKSRRKRTRTTKKPMTVAGSETVATPYAGPQSKLFDGLSFYIMTDQIHPNKKSKADLEALVKANGGKVVQRDAADEMLVVVADKRLVKVASLEKRDTNNIVKPVWIQDCIQQNEVDSDVIPYMLPFEPNRHMFYLLDNDQLSYEENVDENGDSYARDIADIDEMRVVLALAHRPKKRAKFDRKEFLQQLDDHGDSLSHLKTYMFSNIKVAFRADDDPAWMLQVQLAKNYVDFGGGQIAENEDDEGVTHIVVPEGQTAARSKTTGLARVVGVAWVQKCWDEGTMVDEERFQWG